MHAASVHPEPGSNSRKFVSYHLSVLQSYFRAFVALLLLFELYFNSLNCRDSTSHFLFALYLSLCCSIFNDRFAVPRSYSRYLSRGDSTIISHRSRFVNTFFKSFFTFFRVFSFGVLKTLFPLGFSLSHPSFRTACILYYLSSLLSRGFLKFFGIFLSKNIFLE